MAKDDPESSLAEDRAWEYWTYDRSDAEQFRALKSGSAAELEYVFRAGFRAGRKHPERPRHFDAAGNRNWEAPAESPLGIELSKIRDRLNALEVMHEGQPEKTTRWERAIEERIEALERRTGGRMRLS